MAIVENPRICVVIGGNGFVGRSLVLMLLKLRNWIVRIADSDPLLDPNWTRTSSILADAVSNGRALYFQFDATIKSHIIKAIEGVSVVFYAEFTGPYSNEFHLCYMNTVQGVKNIIDVCRDCKVKRLIYRSSADVVFDGSHDIHNGDESLSYPCKFQDMRSDLKVQVEALVLSANDSDGLLTCVLRPSNVFGPGELLLVPFLVNQAKAGWSKFIVGSGENLSDFTYVENVAHAHICAEEALVSRTASVAGKAFFITNLEPIKFWEFASHILEGLGYQGPIIKLPVRMVWLIHLLTKWIHEKVGAEKREHSASAQHMFQLASCTITFNCAAAQKHIGYSPIVSLEEGIMSTVESFSHLAEVSSPVRVKEFNEDSKVDKLLGSGKVADILLWRDEKKTFTYFLTVVLLFYWFCLSGRTFISSAAKLLLLVTVFLYGHGFLPSNIFGFTIQRISLSCFEISETVMKDSITTVAYLWNSGVHLIGSLAQGQDWNIFFKVALPLYFLKLLSSHSLALVIGVALVFAFTLCFVYEQYEEEIDGLAKVLFNHIKKSKEILMSRIVASELRNTVEK